MKRIYWHRFTSTKHDLTILTILTITLVTLPSIRHSVQPLSRVLLLSQRLGLPLLCSPWNALHYPATQLDHHIDIINLGDIVEGD